MANAVASVTAHICQGGWFIRKFEEAWLILESYFSNVRSLVQLPERPWDSPSPFTMNREGSAGSRRVRCQGWGRPSAFQTIIFAFALWSWRYLCGDLPLTMIQVYDHERSIGKCL